MNLGKTGIYIPNQQQVKWVHIANTPRGKKYLGSFVVFVI